MAYATLEQLMESFGWTEISQLLEDEQGLVTEALLKNLVTQADLGEYGPEQIEEGEAALLRVTRALDKQSNFMDSKLAAAYALPLPTNARETAPLEDCCLALTRAALSDDGDNLSTTMKEERKYWRSWLDEIATGKAWLPGVSRTSENGSESRRQASQPRSSVDWSCY